jgi:hypothetical protein
MKALGLLVTFLLPLASATADWHTGTVRSLGFGYDGQTVVFRIAGLSKSGCTCYSPWSDHLCLDRARQSFSQEYAFLLKASAMKEPVDVNINETTCAVIALWADIP